MKKRLIILFLFVSSLVVVNSVLATNLSDEKEVKIFQISFDQNANQNFDDLLLRKTDGFLKYQWEPEGLYIVMEKEVTKNQLLSVLKQLNFSSAYKVNALPNRILPIKLFKN